MAEELDLRYVAAGVIVNAIEEFGSFGMKRHRQWCRTGRDWKRQIAHENKNYVPPIYQKLDELLDSLYGQSFGLYAEVLEIDIDLLYFFFWTLLAGPEVKQCTKCGQWGDPEEDFGYRMDRGKRRIQPWCRSCRKARK